MSTLFPFSLTSPRMLAIAFLGAVIAAIVVRVRRPAIPSASLWLCGLGIVFLCLAAGGPVWQRPSPGEVAVMVDLSPSTRTADFRDRATLERRIHSLLGKVPHRVYYFASDIAHDPPAGNVLPDIPAERTVFKPPAGAIAVVLFSDARFELPVVAPPTYVVLDPLLESPADAAVTSLQVRGTDVIAEISNTGAPRRVTIDGTVNSSPLTASSGATVIARPHDPTASNLAARLSPGDAWPENDQIIALAPPGDRREQWWVGLSSPGAEWRAISPAQLPTAGPAYLAPSTIVLENVAASDLTPLQQQRLGQYVRDLGGGLVILGGDHAFAAGAYPGSELEAISPLASTPPKPTTHWILLADGSGSMNQMQGGFSLWHHATDAIARLIPHLPPDDLLSTGSFAETLTWWTTGKTVRQTASIPLPPANVAPHGPTNLEDSLLNIAKSLEGDEPKQLLLLTDADAEIRDPAGLEAALRQKKIHLHLLAIENGSALPILRPIVRNTGGTIIKQLDPQKWADAIQTLMQAAAPKLLGREALPVHFVGDLSNLPAMQVMPWNRAWLKETATMLAVGSEATQATPAAARWNVGEGRVLAVAFDAGPALGPMLSTSVARPPRDPRYHVTWEPAARLRVSVDASDDQKYLNAKSMRLELSAEAENASAVSSSDVPQTGPGHYELELPAPRSPALATLRVEGHLVDRIAVAGRYAPEFDAIGNDHDAMQELARRTGGQVVPPRQTWPIDFRWLGKPKGMSSILAILGASLIAAGLGWWRWVA